MRSFFVIARICQVLIEIWPFEHEFQDKNLGQPRILGHQICQQTTAKMFTFGLYFHLNSKSEGGSNEQLVIDHRARGGGGSNLHIS